MRSLTVLSTILCVLFAGCKGSSSLSSPSPSPVVPAPTPVPAPPVARSILVSPSGVGIEDATRFSFSLNTNGLPSQGAFVWDFRDGSAVNGASTVNHVFTRSGSFFVRTWLANASDQVIASTTVRVASLVGAWFATVSGHIPYSGVPITWVEIRLNQPLSGPNEKPVSGSWSDSAGCRVSNTSNLFYGSVGHPRSVSVGVEHHRCNYDNDFYLHGVADEEIRVITGTCSGSPNCRFTMTRQ